MSDTEKTEEDSSKILVEKILAEAWSPADILYYGPSSRTISLAGDITKDTTVPLISQLLELDAREPGEPITMYINTEGGTLCDAFSLYDTALSLESPIVTIATGLCASAGLLLLCAGDLRLCHENTVFFYHQAIMPSDILSSKQNAISTTEAYVMSQEMYDKALLERTKMKKTIWKKEFENCTSKYFTAEAAQKYKFIDGILQKTTKPKIDLQV
tara:strand:+ start:163 stop:804 length:642 start_codon:yes stop_codon:yes gene_type:complete